MPGPTRPPAAGWYQDPDDPTCVRHRDTQGWTERRRTRPGWDLPDTDWVAPPLPSDTGGPVLEGPVRSPGLPAIATANSGRPRSVSSRRRIPTSGASSAGLRSATHLSPAPPIQAWNGGRRPLIIVLGLTLVAIIAMALSVVLTRPGHVTPWSLDDPQFLTDANKACATSFTGTRPSPVPAITSGTATPSPNVLTTWASTIDQVSGQIRFLPSVPYDVGRLNIWLSNWSAYSSDETRYAAWLRTASKPVTAAQAKTGQAITTSLNEEATAADAFATSNGLGDCTLSSAPSATTPAP